MNNQALLEKAMSAAEVAAAFREALAQNESISYISVGVGEMFFLAYNNDIPYFKTVPPELTWGKSRYYQYITDQRIHDQILNGISNADIIGLPLTWKPTVYFGEHFPVITTNRICDALMQKGLHFTGLLYEICKGKRVYLVGNQVGSLRPVLEKFQITPAGSTSVDYFEDIPRVKDTLSRADFDLAIVSAGIPTLIIAPWISKTLNRPAFDFGGTVHIVISTLHLIGAKRNDFPVFDPEAKTGFGRLPVKEYRC
jgi:hypothetical protein